MEKLSKKQEKEAARMARGFRRAGGKVPDRLAVIAPRRYAGLIAYPVAVLRRGTRGTVPLVLCRLEGQQGIFLADGHTEVKRFG